MQVLNNLSQLWNLFLNSILASSYMKIEIWLKLNKAEKKVYSSHPWVTLSIKSPISITEANRYLKIDKLKKKKIYRSSCLSSCGQVENVVHASFLPPRDQSWIHVKDVNLITFHPLPCLGSARAWLKFNENAKNPINYLPSFINIFSKEN